MGQRPAHPIERGSQITARLTTDDTGNPAHTG